MTLRSTDHDAIEQRFAVGLERQGKGDLDAAEAAFREVLEAAPDHPGGLHFLGIAAFQRGRLEAALPWLRRSVVLAPDRANFHANLGGVLIAAGHLEEAAAACGRAIEIDPADAESHKNLGIVIFRQGRPSEAAAAFRRALEIRPALVGARNGLGVALQELGQIDAAAEAFRRAIKDRPGFPDAHNNLGNVLREQGLLEEAEAAFRRALEINPDYAEAHRNLAMALRAQGRLEAAETACRRALEIKPDYAEAEDELGNVLEPSGRIEAAEAAYRRAIDIGPEVAEFHVHLGNLLQRRGRLAEAEAAYRQALAIKPDDTAARFDHALIHRFRPGDPELDELAALMQKEGLSDDQRNHLSFALGKAHDDLGRYAEAFSYYRRANQHMAGAADFDAAAHRQRIVEIEEVFRHRPDHAAPQPGPPAPVPIFVVGMSRSGKSLVEALLSQHAEVHGAGEGSGLIDAVRTVLDRHAIAAPFPDCMAFLRDDHIEEIGQRYMKEITKHVSDRRYFVNTLPTHYKYIGLIFRAMPGARVVYCRRDSFDNCLFVYFSRYTRGNSYAYDVKDIASYDAGCRRMMAHWQTLYGAHIHEVRYEALVRDPATEGARLYRYCGLQGQPNARAAAFTTDEIGHWRHYRPHLDVLWRALDEASADSGSE